MDSWYYQCPGVNHQGDSMFACKQTSPFWDASQSLGLFGVLVGLLELPFWGYNCPCKGALARTWRFSVKVPTGLAATEIFLLEWNFLPSSYCLSGLLMPGGLSPNSSGTGTWLNPGHLRPRLVWQWLGLSGPVWVRQSCGNSHTGLRRLLDTVNRESCSFLHGDLFYFIFLLWPFPFPIFRAGYITCISLLKMVMYAWHF